MVKVKNALTIKDARVILADLFVEGFYQWLRFFNKDKQKLKKAFEHIFILEKFYIGFYDNDAAGMAAVSDGHNLVVKMNKRQLITHLGFLRGRLAYYLLRKEFEIINKNGIPPYSEIAFVAVHKDHRRKGVASHIIQYIINNTEFNEYILEVADTNTNAVNLYQKLGFTEFERIKCKNPKRAGFNYLVYMKIKK